MRCCEVEENIQWVKAYEARPRNADGSVRWYLYRWDDGKDGSRRLVRCRRCGAHYLVQAYRLHKFSARRDTLFEDWYLVGSERQADDWNRSYTGIQLEHRMKPAFQKAKERPVCVRVPGGDRSLRKITADPL